MQNFETYLHDFVKLPADAMQALLDLFTPVSMEKQFHFAREGEYCKKLCFIQEGIMRAYYRNPKGEEFNKLFFVNPAIVGGYSSLITGNKNMINIQCLTECTLLQANFQDILDLYEEFPLVERLNRIIAEDFFVKKERREMTLVMNDASERYKIFKEEYPQLENQIAQYHVASYLGVTPTQLSRIRAKRA
ncbi:Crp/Fnr family transcriptional regulator [Fulvivirga ligni]|uniref:Crp/Fnr family transcriptional regulator n=1 Tax=Fulvivirga ligni TaxID=2904246 RepID=UPI001F2141E5|nr:Crp/Fnr family transcriptional regulator [Fulvivirga ligni]UII21494.1 Crp/Fnr family transcriptional regulator [Fulvivirga ligni]